MTTTDNAIELAKLASAPATGALFKSVGDHINRFVNGPAKAAAVNALASIKGYSGYLEETHERVSTFKSFANPTQPVLLLDHFVTTEFTNKSRKKNLNQDGLLAILAKPSRIVISATAGFGKSMVMKFIALSMFENPQGRIPLFLELRHLNRVKTPDLLTFINSSYKQVSSVQIQALKNGLESGLFLLILDGFDELNHEIRHLVESQILEIGRLYPKTSIVVSGRPDDRFESWKSFTSLKICPMSKTQVVELLNKLEYDRETKKRFIAKIKNGLYETHESFLSTPLLSILMLLTFEQNANIPDKVHLFYSKAFEVLFHKHDAMKEQYDRSRKSGLRIDEFEKVFSTFCLKTYVQEKTEFSKSEILNSIQDAIKYEGLEVNPENFLFDIEEAVCLVMREGASFFFVHRSFQEYFTAVFLAHCPEGVRDDFLDTIATRHWDTVLPMLFDMAAAQIEPTWVLNRTDQYLDKVGLEPGKTSPLEARFSALGFFRPGNKVETYIFAPGAFSQFIGVMRRFYRSMDSSYIELQFRELEDFAKQNWDATIAVPDEAMFGDDMISIRNFPISSVPDKLLVSSGLTELAQREFEAIKQIKKSVKTEQKSRHDFLEKLFSESN